MSVEMGSIFVLAGLLLALTAAQGALVPLNQGLVWGLGSRDQAVDKSALQGRFARTVANHSEAMLIFIPLMALALALGLQNSRTQLAAWLVIGGRTAFIPLYLAGVPGLRSLAYGVAMFGNFVLTAQFF